MASPSDSISMALFCDFENVALGVRDAQYEKFDIKPVLERLLLKGSIVVKKAYCDWERYKGFKATMHEANFELIEIPHVRQSGKNSADIRLVVDALDLCYTKSHVNTFVIISGDSDFSPLVSKLRENNKQVIGVGVKQSTSDLLIANCDEFIFYDDLVREKQRALARRQPPGAAPAPRRSPEEERHRKESQEVRRAQGVELAVETFEALTSERGDSGKIWASVLKEAIKRRKPDFSEGYYGFRTFGNLLEEAQARGLLEFGRDEKSGAYVFRGHGPAATGAEPVGRADAPAERQGGAGYFRHDFHAVASVPEASAGGSEGGGRGGRSRGRRGDAAARAGAVPPDARQDMPAETRAEPPASGARDDALPERPAGSYFRPQLPAPVTAQAQSGHETAQGEDLADEEPVHVHVQAPVAAPAAEGTASDALPDAPAPAPAPRSRRPASTPRKSSGGRKAGAAGAAAPAEAGAPAAPSSKAAAPAAAPAKAAATRARKPRGAGKPPQPAE
ncbi:NYN domain-containing protein [Acidovorax sp. sif0715]|uniref:NYN domain-containing protein n=2 Tax=unclassified Acidovorax TaxID=2684926 RepID=UPI001C4369EF|nr:NYN domain-containing protein [Acidovorax sp. sif0715]MBV7449681.1 NYN domain-containing protein [Acidovorax sp. sif0715]